jgi:hypothetical protein
MKNRLLVVLIVLAVVAVSSVELAAAQESTTLTAMVVEGATLYAEPSEAAETVAELASGAMVDVLATDQAGAWLEVESDAGAGYVMLDSVMVLNIPMLAPKMVVNTERAVGTKLFSEPSFSSSYLAPLPKGTVANVLGVSGDWAYIQTAAGTGWSTASTWGDASGMLQSVSTEMLAGGVAAYDTPKLNAEPVAILPPGMNVYVVGEADPTYSQIYVGGLGLAYVQTKNLGDPTDMTALYVEATTEMLAGGVALYDAPQLNAEPVGILPSGSVVMWVESADETYAKVYVPAYGEVYVQAKNLSNPFSVATVQVADAVVRAGPNDNLYGAVALLPAGTPVLVKGVSETGAWVEVAIPFDEVDFGYNGVSGWMRDFLFVDGAGETDLDTSMLAVTE